MTVSWQSIFSIYQVNAKGYRIMRFIDFCLPNALMDTSNKISVQVILIVWTVVFRKVIDNSIKRDFCFICSISRRSNGSAKAGGVI